MDGSGGVGDVDDLSSVDGSCGVDGLDGVGGVGGVGWASGEKKYRLFCMPTHVDLKERDLNAFMRDSDKKLVRNQM